MGIMTAFTVGMGAAAIGYSVFSMLNQKKPKEQSFEMPKAPDAPKPADAAKVAQERMAARKRAAARTPTVRTSPLGLRDEAEIVKKKLLGG